ncbi:chromosome segregation protein SMC [Mycoplasmopsis citelli]|uniref:Chromosome segregation protein SMC n=1 Tax=Mycoplasmopsis citelli TaxID=171281 RepID=A0A449B2V2_9BACT|nr:hypothetical protein [Mycoplasmopsis citelli]VEU74913.1 chromosome segregation protein SMC [Mycoplasmopsis citelli]
MKIISKRHLLLVIGGISLIGATSGIAIGTTKNIYETKISSLNEQINLLNLQFQEYSIANKEDKSKIQTLQSQSKNLQFLVQNLQENNLSSENLDDFLSKVNQQKISEDGYKEFEKPLQNWKSNLVKKVSTLTKTLKNLLNKTNNLIQETQQGITESLNKAKNLLNSLEQITFNDTKSAVKAFKAIQKSQNIFLNQLNSSISLIVGQINKHNQEVSNLKEQIGQRDEKIKELAEKLASQLRFYLKSIKQFKNSLQDFNDFDFEQFGADQSEKIKTQIQKNLKLIKTKETVFSELLDQMNESLADAQDNNDYSDVQSYDLNVVQNSFEKIVKGYDLIRNVLIPLYTKWNQEKGLEIVNQAKQISDLESQTQVLQAQIDSLNTQKTTLEEELSKTKEDLLSTKTELENAKSELTEQQQKLSDNEKALDNINTELAQNKNSLESIQESLRNTQAQLTTLNSELDNNNLQAESTFNSIKSVYDDLKVKANNLIREIDNSIDVSQLQIKLDEQLIDFNEITTTEEKLASIKNLIQKSTELSNLYNEVAQKDFDFKTQKSNEQIINLQSQNQAIQTQIQELQAKQARFSSVLSRNITTLNNAYNSTKTEAQKIVDTAKRLSLPTTELENLLRLQDLSSLGSDLNAQINYVEQYTNRISKLSEKTLEMQNAIIDKTTIQANQSKKELEDTKKQKKQLEKEKKLLAKKDTQNQAKITKLQNTISAKEKELQNAISQKDQALREKEQIRINGEIQHQQDQNTINDLNDQKGQLNSNLYVTKKSLETSEAIRQQLNKEKQELQNQLDSAKIDLNDKINNYKKWREAIINSNLYKNATETYNYKNDSGRTNALTGYGDYYDKYYFGDYFSKLYPGKTPDSVSVIQKFPLRLRNKAQGEHTFRIWYIDTNESDSTKQLKSTIKTWEYNMSDKWQIGLGEMYHNSSAKDSNTNYIHSEYFVINKINDWAPNKVEFIYAMASWDKNKKLIWDLKAKQVIVSIEELDNN